MDRIEGMDRREGMDRIYREGAETETTGRNKCHVVYGDDYDHESRKSGNVT
jgi:hypothetical protein